MCSFHIFLNIGFFHLLQSKITDHVVVGTPGKLWDFANKARVLDLSRVKVNKKEEKKSFNPFFSPTGLRS